MIIPGCSDLNRGDQSLVWETKRLAEDSGYTGTCYLISEINEPTVQSENRGIKIISPILEHPSRKSSNKNNISYGRITLFPYMTLFRSAPAPHSGNGTLPRLPVSGQFCAPAHHTDSIPPATRQDFSVRSGGPYSHTDSSMSPEHSPHRNAFPPPAGR